MIKIPPLAPTCFELYGHPKICIKESVCIPPTTKRQQSSKFWIQSIIDYVVTLPVVNLDHFILSHGQLRPLLGDHVVLLVVQLLAVGQLATQSLQLDKLEKIDKKTHKEENQSSNPVAVVLLFLCNWLALGTLIDIGYCHR